MVLLNGGPQSQTSHAQGELGLLVAELRERHVAIATRQHLSQECWIVASWEAARSAVSAGGSVRSRYVPRGAAQYRRSNHGDCYSVHFAVPVHMPKSPDNRLRHAAGKGRLLGHR